MGVAQTLLILQITSYYRLAVTLPPVNSPTKGGPRHHLYCPATCWEVFEEKPVFLSLDEDGKEQHVGLVVIRIQPPGSVSWVPVPSSQALSAGLQSCLEESEDSWHSTSRRGQGSVQKRTLILYSDRPRVNVSIGTFSQNKHFTEVWWLQTTHT